MIFIVRILNTENGHLTGIRIEAETETKARVEAWHRLSRLRKKYPLHSLILDEIYCVNNGEES